MPSLALPDMTLPFESFCHPAIDDAEAYGVQWAARFMPDHVLDALRKARAGRIIAHTSPPWNTQFACSNRRWDGPSRAFAARKQPTGGPGC